MRSKTLLGFRAGEVLGGYVGETVRRRVGELTQEEWKGQCVPGGAVGQ